MSNATSSPFGLREPCVVCHVREARHEVGLIGEDQGSADPRAVVRVCAEGCALLAAATLRGTQSAERRTR